jgi:hypothetical protein
MEDDGHILEDESWRMSRQTARVRIPRLYDVREGIIRATNYYTTYVRALFVPRIIDNSYVRAGDNSYRR